MGKNSPKIIVKIAFIVMILFFLGLLIVNIQLCASIKQMSKIKEAEFDKKVAHEREVISKDLEAKHATDYLKYYDLAKKLDSQKNLVKELETKVTTQPSTTHPAKRLKK
ncbi:MAG: hypothetical protein PHY94_04715 [Candidatus Omnitrophica bacterium]|nr:hypothetical protein [Candidatus Omnitrophota bacterium]